MSNDDELEQLRQQSTSGGGNRIDADAAKQNSAVDDLVDALERIDEGDSSATLSFWGKSEAAAVDVLMTDDERRTAMLEAFAEELGAEVDVDDASQSDLLKLAIRYAIADVDPELVDDLREARRERAMAKADEGL
ncbi:MULTISPECIES: hypothetical protein [Halolamina]|uniref:DUF8115 domain-containing protein n=1 Tax=Halolamina pelagica TaxID=699431 RepID=A0A1I5VQ09_9EURY|nr:MULTISPECIES: hypothetical protein [Halolamina]NHX37831.1 hypothetical protein [Halolamina sp. R1-12]SFQ09513.1 hypothetical protein SAMN05216277_11922 [Halolamina pelagica]